MAFKTDKSTFVKKIINLIKCYKNYNHMEFKILKTTSEIFINIECTLEYFIENNILKSVEICRSCVNTVKLLIYMVKTSKELFIDALIKIVVKKSQFLHL
ncbi:hypothetical protein DMUE_2371, partial [Dictyocoela muelleri]